MTTWNDRSDDRNLKHDIITQWLIERYVEHLITTTMTILPWKYDI
jgi:hypothetical protein